MDETRPKVTIDKRDEFTVERRPAPEEPDLVITIREEGQRRRPGPVQVVRAFGGRRK